MNRIAQLSLIVFLCSTFHTNAQKMTSKGASILNLSLDWMAIADDDGTLDYFKGFQIPASTETGVYSKDETKIVTTAKGDFTVRVFDAKNGKQLWKNDGEAETEAADFTNDNQYVVTGGEAEPQIKVWSANDGILVHSMEDHQSIEGILFSPDGSLLACGNEVGEIRIYDTSDPDPTQWPNTPKYILVQGKDQDKTGNKADGHSDVNQVVWSHDGKYMYSAGRNSLVKKWKVKAFDNPQKALMLTYKGHTGSIKCVRLSQDGKYLASGSGSEADARVVMWEEKSGKTLLNIDVVPERIIETVVFDPKTQILMCGGSDRAKARVNSESWLWRINDILEGKDKPAQVIHWYDVEFFEFNKAGTTLVSSHADGSLRAWKSSINLAAIEK